jgi:hypothetical protein
MGRRVRWAPTTREVGSEGLPMTPDVVAGMDQWKRQETAVSWDADGGGALSTRAEQHGVLLALLAASEIGDGAVLDLGIGSGLVAEAVLDAQPDSAARGMHHLSDADKAAAFVWMAALMGPGRLGRHSGTLAQRTAISSSTNLIMALVATKSIRRRWQARQSRSVRPRTCGGGDTHARRTTPPWQPAQPDLPNVYVTLATVLEEPDVLRLLLDALAIVECNVLMTIGRRGDPASLAPWPANATVERFYRRRRCSVVVSHGGSGKGQSVRECAVGGLRRRIGPQRGEASEPPLVQRALPSC